MGRHCLFRHCSGLVCAHKLMKRRKNRQHCVHLRVSHDVVSDHWRIYDKSMHNNKDNIKDGKENSVSNEEIINMLHMHKGEISNEISCNAEKKESKKDISEKDKKNIELKSTLNRNIPRLSPRILETRCEENKNFEKSNILKDIRNDIKYPLKCINENILEKKNSSHKTNKIDTPRECLRKTSNKKFLSSDLNFSKTIITDNCMNSILYHDLRKKYTPTIKNKLSKDYLEIDKVVEFNLSSEMEDAEKINAHQELDVDKIMNNFLNDVQVFPFKQKQRCNLKHSINKHQFSNSRLQKKYSSRNSKIGLNMQQKTFPTLWYKNTMKQRKLSKFFCQNCNCNTKLVRPFFTTKFIE